MPASSRGSDFMTIFCGFLARRSRCYLWGENETFAALAFTPRARDFTRELDTDENTGMGRASR
jgi:hypothetical protein